MPLAVNDEPRDDTPCDARPIQPGIVYQAYAEDREDWYVFDVATISSIQVDYASYLGDGQFQLKQQGASCAVSTTHLAHVYGVSGVVMSPVTAGRYYLRVVTVDRYDAQTPYRFRLSVNSANWQPDFTTSSTPYQPDTHLDDVYPGEQKVFRWYGIGSRQGGVSEIAIKVYGEPNGEQCPSGWPESVIPAGYTAAHRSVNSVMDSGAFIFTFPMPGIYVVDLRVRRVGQPDWLDSKPVRVGCRPGPWVTPIPPLAPSQDGHPNTDGSMPDATALATAPAPTQTPVP